MKAFRDAGAVARIRQTTAFPRLIDLLDAISDALIDVDETTEDVMIDLPRGPVRLDQVPISRSPGT